MIKILKKLFIAYFIIVGSAFGVGYIAAMLPIPDPPPINKF